MKNAIKSFRSDFIASIVVFFIALPLCLGIALASGAPLFSGIIAGVVGGIVVGILSGSAIGVSGPATGLVTIIFGYLASVGGTWEAFLFAVILMGIIQILLGYLKLGTIAYYFPSSVINGMLAGIGLTIILKQLPHALGYDFSHTKEYALTKIIEKSYFFEIQNILDHINLGVVIISLISIFTLIFWETFLTKKYKFFKIIPSPLFVVGIGIAMSTLFLYNLLPFSLGENQLVKLPTPTSSAEFLGQFHLPDFSQITNPRIYILATILAIVASLETLLSAEASDKLDLKKRITPTNRELKAQGFGNIISGLIGGLPITQVALRSSVNVEFGAKTKLSTILHGIIMMICVISIPRLLNMIPIATLACILIAIGYKLSKPHLFKKMYNSGWQQFTPFIVTILAMLLTDLLEGVALGIATSIYCILYNIFKNPYHHIEDKEGAHHEHIIRLAEEVSFLNKGRILELLSKIQEGSKVVIDGSHSKNIHPDVLEVIKDFMVSAKSKRILLEIKGIKNYNAHHGFSI